MSLLDAAGYAQYEISNVCKPGRQSRHNLKYWTDGEWLGLRTGRAFDVAGQPMAKYLVHGGLCSTNRGWGRGHRGSATLSNDERLGDALFTGLRLNEGVDLDILARRYGVDVWERFGARLMPFCDGGHPVEAGWTAPIDPAGDAPGE